MRTIRIPIVVFALLVIALPTAIVYAFVQQAEAQRQTEIAVQNAAEAVKQHEFANDQRNAAIAAQREAEVQRMMAQQHLIQAEEALAKCRGTK